MKRVYETKEDIFSLVRSFEDASIPRDEWKHAEHLIVALYYVSHHDIVTAAMKMREGILNLLVKGFDVDLSKEMPYHETITLFWIRTVAKFNASKNGASVGEKVKELIERFDKDYPLKFYSKELLFSDEARARFTEPDLRLFD
jgi:hypothetical protein